MTFGPWARRATLAVALLLFAQGSPAIADSQVQGAPASAIRAGMILNFAKFVEWPPDHGPAETLALCVVGDELVADALDTMVRGRRLQNRDASVRRLKFDGPLRDCHVLYAAGLDKQSSRQLIERVKGAAVFSVSDFERFATMGGIVNFFVAGGRMRFAINPAAAQRAGLKVSSQVLGVGTIVKDEDAQ